MEIGDGSEIQKRFCFFDRGISDFLRLCGIWSRSNSGEPQDHFSARLFRLVELNNQVEACRRIFEGDTKWTVERGSDLEEGESQGLPVWSRHEEDPILESNLTRRSDFALFMIAALENDELIHEAPAIVGCQSASALAHA